VVAGLPTDVSVKFACRRGIARREIAAELRSGNYHELVVSPALLSQRCLERLRRDHPDLRVELVHPTPDPLRSEYHSGVPVPDHAVL
jgi:hypothetical protein